MMQLFHTRHLTFQLKDLSTYRSELMGWSILWIMMLHFQFITIKPLGFIAQYGFAGVDIFMFVSGLGLYHSLRRYSSIGFFYLKRAKRIFPTYYFVGIIASIVLFHDNLLSYLFRYTTIGFWTGGLYFEWYIPSIVILYLLAPAVYRMLLHCNLLLWISCLCILILSFFIVRDHILSGEKFFFFYRIPSFIGGMYCSKLIEEGGSSRHFLYLALIGIPFFTIFYPIHHDIYLFKYYALFFLLPSFLTIMCFICKFMGRFNVILQEIGSASLEIYLIQMLFFIPYCNNNLIISDSWHDCFTIALIIGCCIMGIILHNIVRHISFFH